MSHRSTQEYLNGKRRRTGAAVMATALRMRIERFDRRITIMEDMLNELDMDAVGRMEAQNDITRILNRREESIVRMREYLEDIRP